MAIAVGGRADSSFALGWLLAEELGSDLLTTAMVALVLGLASWLVTTVVLGAALLPPRHRWLLQHREGNVVLAKAMSPSVIWQEGLPPTEGPTRPASLVERVDHIPDGVLIRGLTAQHPAAPQPGVDGPWCVAFQLGSDFGQYLGGECVDGRAGVRAGGVHRDPITGSLAHEGELYDGQPVHRAIVQRLRRSGVRGATALRGIWGFAGNHTPHGDRLLQFGRRVPVLTVVIDSPEAIAASFTLIDELTGDHGVVSSETPQPGPLHRTDHGRHEAGRRHHARCHSGARDGR